SAAPGILAFDMGGTTAKLSLVDDGEPLTAYSFEAARQRRFIEGSGLPIRISTIELIEIGAGGGSIADVDEIGLLKVGPRSAGSYPGPASYGLGGTAPPVTDADFRLGYLNAGYSGGGEVRVDREAARAAVERLAGRIGLEPVKVAWGIHDIVNENMASAARVHIAERGRDPRDYALLSTGGAGPVHAWSVAKKLGVSRIVCPPSAGVASALGLLLAPARVDRVATVGLRPHRGHGAELGPPFPGPGGGGPRGHGRHWPQARDGRRAPARRRPLHGAGLRPRRLAARRTLRRERSEPPAPHRRLRDRLSRQVRPHPSGCARGVPQHP